MGNSLRCCLACVIPCGSLDVIRIVHLNGYVDQISHPVNAGEILKNYPNHVLSKPSSAAQGGVVRRIMIVSPESELQRGSIYFLIPATSVPEKKKVLKKDVNVKKVCDVNVASLSGNGQVVGVAPPTAVKKSLSQRSRRRSGKVGVWRPHLESISED